VSSTEIRVYEDDVLRASGIEEIQVAAFPTEKRVLAARDSLLQLIADFPLRSDRCRSAWLAGLLTVVARPRLLRGPAPVFVVSADEHGLGASLLCDVVAVLATGQRMRRDALPGTSQRDLYRSMAAIRNTSGSTAICVEPVHGKLRPRSFAIDCEDNRRTVWWFNGVDVQIQKNWSRVHGTKSLVTMHLAAELRRPASDLHIPDLCGFVTEYREGYLVECLTLLRAAIRKLPVAERFGWSDLIQGALAVAQLADPFAGVQS